MQRRAIFGMKWVLTSMVTAACLWMFMLTYVEVSALYKSLAGIG